MQQLWYYINEEVNKFYREVKRMLSIIALLSDIPFYIVGFISLITGIDSSVLLVPYNEIFEKVMAIVEFIEPFIK